LEEGEGTRMFLGVVNEESEWSRPLTLTNIDNMKANDKNIRTLFV
jgi:hypothetical protein